MEIATDPACYEEGAVRVISSDLLSLTEVTVIIKHNLGSTERLRGRSL